MLPQELVWPIAIVKWVDIVYKRVERGFFFFPTCKEKIQRSSKTVEQKAKIQKNRFLSFFFLNFNFFSWKFSTYEIHF